MRAAAVIDDGVVSFVGAGPGDPGLRSARAEERLGRADDVVHERDDVPASRLVELARAGRRVVCLFAGDPLESPRALEQIRAVSRAGVPFEIVPAAGARAAAGAFAGVVGRAVRVPASAVGDAVAGEDVGAPVTLVAAAGTSAQRVVVTSAGRAAGEARALGDAAIIVAFGAPDDALRWFDRRPLFGKRVLVTRASEQAGRTAALLRDQGAEPVVVPTIAIHPPADPAALRRALDDVRAGRYGWVVFTSANGVERTWQAVEAAGGDARVFGPARLAVIGPATARALEARGLRPDVTAREFIGEGLAQAILAALGAAAPPRVLVARAARARDALPDALRRAGCAVDVVAAYETRPAPADAVDALARELEAGRVDAVTFTSSSTVDNLCDLLGPRAAELLARARVASIGPVTTRTAQARGVRVDVTAAEYTVPALIGALARSWAR